MLQRTFVVLVSALVAQSCAIRFRHSVTEDAAQLEASAEESAVDVPSIETMEASLDASPDTLLDGSIDQTDTVSMAETPESSLDVSDASPLDTMDAEASVDVMDATRDALADGPVMAPRAIAPLSGTLTTLIGKEVRWIVAPGSSATRLEWCADRACTTVLMSETVPNARTRSNTPRLGEGVFYWRLLALGAGGEVLSSSASWSLHIAHGAGMLERSARTVFDPNGDGIADLAVVSDWANMQRGLVRYYEGRAEAAPRFVRDIEGTIPAGTFGTNISNAGDVDGDGYVDAIVGASIASQAILLRGGPNGLDASRANIVTGLVNTRFGRFVQGLGDFDGDGFADVAVTTDTGFSAPPRRVWIYWGARDGLNAARSTSIVLLPDTRDFETVWLGSQADLDGDGRFELLVADRTTRTVHAYRATPERTLLRIASVTGPPATNDLFSFGVAGVGDLDGDGLGEFAVAAPNTNNARGAVHVYAGTRTGTPRLLVTINAPDEADGFFFGWELHAAGDCNGDGFTDVVLGARGVNNNLGRAYVFYGGADGYRTMRSTAISSPFGLNGNFGVGTNGLGDIDNDGFDDVGIGAFRSASERITEAGAVGVFRGSATGITPSVFFRDFGNGVDWHLGWSLL